MTVRHPSELDATPARIACPVCGGDTGVTETRQIVNGLRRRRRCRNRDCAGRLTTYEVPAPDTARWRGKQMVLVPLDKLDSLSALVDSLRPKDDPWP